VGPNSGFLNGSSNSLYSECKSYPRKSNISPPWGTQVPLAKMYTACICALSFAIAPFHKGGWRHSSLQPNSRPSPFRFDSKSCRSRRHSGQR
jgi:hypothetical protein